MTKYTILSTSKKILFSPTLKQYWHSMYPNLNLVYKDNIILLILIIIHLEEKLYKSK